MTADDVRRAQIIAAQLLPMNEAVGEEQIRAAVHRATSLVSLTPEETEHLVRALQASYTVSVGIAGTLDDNRNHIEWLPERREQLDWRAWDRYRRFLIEVKQFPPQVVSRLDEVTDQILMRFEDPRRSGSWDRRGMVVGHVQSGKTANYAGLINKAVDSGYKVIVVLTGMDDSLRSQTQVRMDESVVGYDTSKRLLADQSNTRLGVGQLRGASTLNINSLTSSDQKGDFKKAVAQNSGVNPGGKDPILLVVKKNKAILNNLISWITSFDALYDETNTRVLYNTPLLVIDDECDFASINTRPNDPDVEPTAINLCVRKLLKSFDQSAYVGYTATPFANIFITPDSASLDEYGEDLFPRDFIISLKRSSDYVGATRVFGIEEDPTTGLEESEPLPIIRIVDDQESWLSPNHKNGFQIGPALPSSLRKAILCFILACAAREQRGQTNQHNSMLIHVTRFKNVQRDVAKEVSEELSIIRQRIVYGEPEKSQTVLGELKELWEKDFNATSVRIDEYSDFVTPWSEVEPHVSRAVAKITVRIVNGDSQEALEYFENRDGVSVIAVGGSKLSRGLTLEGLTVSYYLRTSKMYDTLMQMGRWFGYRPRYLDLCRIFTTEELVDWYRETALASEDLLMQFDEMTLTGGTPSAFGLRVRNSTSGLLVTRAGAMREGTKMKLSFSGDITETIKFRTDEVTVATNLEAAATLLQTIGSGADYEPRNQKLVWSGISPSPILEFLASYETHPDNYKVNRKFISQYIWARNRDNPAELTSWTVAVVDGPNSPFKIGDYSVGQIIRKQLSTITSDYTIKRLVSPSDERVDLSEDQRLRAMQQTRAMFDRGYITTKSGSPPTEVSGRAVREVRPPAAGLLIVYLVQPTPELAMSRAAPYVGFAISFPRSARGEASAIDYVANAVYRVSEIDDE